ncbi:hypothetical protein Y032_0016g3009 [Ancylostoma ceylanicum]|nr:hypothetical protein Y032_0016g3009 [Ancylostoma ceylanicum]
MISDALHSQIKVKTNCPAQEGDGGAGDWQVARGGRCGGLNCGEAAATHRPFPLKSIDSGTPILFMGTGRESATQIKPHLSCFSHMRRRSSFRLFGWSPFLMESACFTLGSDCIDVFYNTWTFLHGRRDGCCFS